MKVRNAEDHEEVWLLNHLNESQLDELTFESDDYRVAFDEERGERKAFGRKDVHLSGQDKYFEVKNVGSVESAEEKAAVAVIEHLLTEAYNNGFDFAYAFPSSETEAFSKVGFSETERTELPVKLEEYLDNSGRNDVYCLKISVSEWAEDNDVVGDEEEDEKPTDEEIEKLAEEFRDGEPEEQTHKYSTS